MALRAAGMPPKEASRDLVISTQSAPAHRIQPVHADNLSEMSGSESDSPEMSPGRRRRRRTENCFLNHGIEI